jgi:hypothetical protein
MRVFGLAVMLLFAAAPTVRAGEAVVEADGGTRWQAGIDGVEIEWAPDGSVKRLYSRYGQPVEFADRRGISGAQTISEEKAKAAIVRFMDQRVSSSRLVTEVESDLGKATQERQASGTQVKKVDERTLLTSLSDVSGSYASGQLRGVIVLEKGYDEKTGEAWAVVGISDKTIRAALAVKNMNDRPKAVPNTETSRPANPLGLQNGEVKRTNQKDW